MKRTVIFDNGRQYSYDMRHGNGLQKVFQTFLGDKTATEMRMNISYKPIAVKYFIKLRNLMHIAVENTTYEMETFAAYPSKKVMNDDECIVGVKKHARRKLRKKVHKGSESGNHGAGKADDQLGKSN